MMFPALSADSVTSEAAGKVVEQLWAGSRAGNAARWYWVELVRGGRRHVKRMEMQLEERVQTQRAT